MLDRVLGAWLWTRAVLADGRLVIAIDGKTVRGAKSKEGKAPHLVAALAHGIGAVLGQVAVDEKSNEIPAVRELLKAFTDLAGAVFTIDAMHTQHDTAQAILGRGADYVMTVKANMPTLYRQLKRAGANRGRPGGWIVKTAEGAFWSELVLDRGALGSYRLDELPDDLPVLRVVPVELVSLEVVEVGHHGKLEVPLDQAEVGSDVVGAQYWQQRGQPA